MRPAKLSEIPKAKRPNRNHKTFMTQVMAMLVEHEAVFVSKEELDAEFGSFESARRAFQNTYWLNAVSEYYWRGAFITTAKGCR